MFRLCKLGQEIFIVYTFAATICFQFSKSNHYIRNVLVIPSVSKLENSMSFTSQTNSMEFKFDVWYFWETETTLNEKYWKDLRQNLAKLKLEKFNMLNSKFEIWLWIICHLTKIKWNNFEGWVITKGSIYLWSSYFQTSDDFHPLSSSHDLSSVLRW